MRNSASGSVVEGEGVGHKCPIDSYVVEMLNRTVWAWVSWGVSLGWRLVQGRMSACWRMSSVYLEEATWRYCW